MIQLVVRQESVDGVKDYLERVRQRILAAIRDGMEEAMQGLAQTAIEEMAAAGIKSRTGQLVENIDSSPEVKETAEYVRGTVSAERDITLGGRKSKHLGLWFEEGYHVPAVPGHLYQFTAADGNTVFTRGHRAFDVKPHPFMNPALEKFKQPIMDIIAARVAEAY